MLWGLVSTFNHCWGYWWHPPYWSMHLAPPHKQPHVGTVQFDLSATHLIQTLVLLSYPVGSIGWWPSINSYNKCQNNLFCSNQLFSLFQDAHLHQIWHKMSCFHLQGLVTRSSSDSQENLSVIVVRYICMDQIFGYTFKKKLFSKSRFSLNCLHLEPIISFRPSLLFCVKP